MKRATLERSTEPAAPTVTMTSVVQDEYGAAPEAVLRLAEVAKPAAGDDEVLVRVSAASVDKGTWHLMAGLPYLMRAAGYGGARKPKATNPGLLPGRHRRFRRQERDRVPTR